MGTDVESQGDIKKLIAAVSALTEKFNNQDKNQEKLEAQIKELISAIHDKFNATAAASYVLEVDERVKKVEKFIDEKVATVKNYGAILNILYRYGPTFVFAVALIGSNFMSIDIAKKLPSKYQENQIKVLQTQLKVLQEKI